MVINQTNKHKAKIYNYCAYTKIIIKKIYFFSSQCIRMSGNNINFDHKKIKISTFMKTKAKNNWSLKKYHKTKIIHLNTSMDIMIMTLLDHYL